MGEMEVGGPDIALDNSGTVYRNNRDGGGTRSIGIANGSLLSSVSKYKKLCLHVIHSYHTID